MRRESLETIINTSINETLSRTIITISTAILVLRGALPSGGAVIRPFAFALLVGFFSGVYSTIFIASPVILLWDKSPQEVANARSASVMNSHIRERSRAYTRSVGRSHLALAFTSDPNAWPTCQTMALANRPTSRRSTVVADELKLSPLIARILASARLYATTPQPVLPFIEFTRGFAIAVSDGRYGCGGRTHRRAVRNRNRSASGETTMSMAPPAHRCLVSFLARDRRSADLSCSAPDRRGLRPKCRRTAAAQTTRRRARGDGRLAASPIARGQSRCERLRPRCRDRRSSPAARGTAAGGGGGKSAPQGLCFSGQRHVRRWAGILLGDRFTCQASRSGMVCKTAGPDIRRHFDIVTLEQSPTWCR